MDLQETTLSATFSKFVEENQLLLFLNWQDSPVLVQSVSHCTTRQNMPIPFAFYVYKAWNK